jgi:hypothetical protein
LQSPRCFLRTAIVGAVFLIVPAPFVVLAGEVTVPHTFESGEKALASEVNENFSDVATAVNGNAADIEGNATQIQTNAAAIAQNRAAIPIFEIADMAESWVTEGREYLYFNDVGCDDTEPFIINEIGHVQLDAASSGYAEVDFRYEVPYSVSYSGANLRFLVTTQQVASPAPYFFNGCTERLECRIDPAIDSPHPGLAGSCQSTGLGQVFAGGGSAVPGESYFMQYCTSPGFGLRDGCSHDPGSGIEALKGAQETLIRIPAAGSVNLYLNAICTAGYGDSISQALSSCQPIAGSGQSDIRVRFYPD